MSKEEMTHSSGGPLGALFAGVSVALWVVALEALALHGSGGPVRPLESLGFALVVSLAAGVGLGLIGALFARGPAASERVRFGLPLALLVPFVIAVHLRGFVLGPGDALLSFKSLALFGVLIGVGLVVAVMLVRGSRESQGSRAPLLFLTGLLAIAGVWGLEGGFQSAPASASSPNVVLVVLDTTRVDRLSAFGYGRQTTPTLSALAAEGTSFARCYSAAPWTVPSHAAMFTGEHTSTHKATRQRPILDGRLPTLAEKMRASGYHTVSFSKKSWLSGETGLLRGFEEIHDLHNPPGEFALPWLLGQFNKHPKILDKGAADIVQDASTWIEKHAQDQSFFAFFNFNEAHSDLRPPRRFREDFLAEEDYGVDWGRSRFPENHDFSVGKVSYSEEDLALLSDLYDAEIAYQDSRLGELVEAFRKAGVLDKTLFLVTADHGENLGEHGLLGHEMSLHETLLHVPLVARWPDHIEPGAVLDAPVENRLVGQLIGGLLAEPDQAGGAELVALLQDSGAPGIVSEEYAPNFKSPKWDFQVDERFDRIRKTLVQGELKLSFASQQEAAALFDVLQDPGELTDLSQSRAQETEALLKSLLQQADLWQEVGSSSVEFSSEMQDRLQQTGYF